MWKTLFSMLLALALMACQKVEPESGQPIASAVRQKITLACAFQPQSALIHIALAKGFFAEEGLDVTAVMHTYGKTALQSVLENKADFATVAETPVMFSVLEGDKLFVIASISTSNTNNAIISRRDAGIATPPDLQGKRIGFTPGTTSDFFLDSMLTAQGLRRQDIQAVPLNPQEMQNALTQAHSVDAVATWNYPLTQIKRQLGANAVVFFDRQLYTEIFNITARQAFIQNHPDAAKRLLRALIKAENFAALHPDTAQSLLSAATRMDIDLIQEVWSAFHFRVRLDSTLQITLEDETRWALKNKLIGPSAMPDYRQIIHQNSLKAVKPEAIALGG